MIVNMVSRFRKKGKRGKQWWKEEAAGMESCLSRRGVRMS